jgi:cytidylate kinase
MTGCQGGVPPAVVAISGPIGAGKTTVASLLAGRLGWPRAAYSDLIRSVATSRGLTHDRATLQQIGTELIATGWDTFTRQVLGQVAWTPGEPLIIDGLRHCDAATSLASAVAPVPTVVIYLDVPSEVGTARARRRDQVPADSAQRAERHPVESGLPAVRAIADLAVPASDTRPAALASRIIEHLQSSVASPVGLSVTASHPISTIFSDRRTVQASERFRLSARPVDLGKALGPQVPAGSALRTLALHSKGTHRPGPEPH